MGHFLRIESSKLLQVFFYLFPYGRLAAAFPTQPRTRGDYEMALEPEVGFTLSGEALRLCSFYHVQPPIKLRVNQGSLPIGERALDKSDAVCALLRTARWLSVTYTWQVVEKKKPGADMHGRVMAVLNCEDGFVVTAENFSKIPVLG